MNITVYLPDELGQWAKDAGLNLSQTLRAEVERERRRRAAGEVAPDPEVFMLQVEDGEGRAYGVRFHGVPLHEKRNGVQAFIGENDGLYAHDERDSSFGQFGDGASTVSRAEWLREWLDGDEDYIEAMAALGEPAVIDVGLAIGTER